MDEAEICSPRILASTHKQIDFLPDIVMKEGNSHLYSRLQGEKGIARIAHLEYASKPIFCQIANLQYLQIRRDGTQIEFIDQDIINDYGRFRSFVESGRKHLPRTIVEVCIGS